MTTKFRLRRWIFGKHRRNKIVSFFANQSLKNIAHYNNEDRNHIRNGEFWLQKTLIRYFETKGKTPTIFDVGANIGDWASQILQLSTNIDLHCFEPSKETFNTLSKRLSSYPNVALNMTGLSREEHNLEFYENDAPDVTSLYPRFEAKNETKISVNLISGDNYLLEKQIETIDFLKIDIEGMVYDALLGFKESLRKDKIQLIQFEYGEFNIQSEKLLKHFYELLPNYYLGRLYPEHVEIQDWHHNLETFKSANIIAINKKNVDMLRLFGLQML